MYPEKKPPDFAGWQALLKSPSTTLWLPPAAKLKVIVSPIAALISLGLKAIVPPWPTVTIWVAALACIARLAVVRRMLIRADIIVGDITGCACEGSSCVRDFERVIQDHFGWTSYIRQPTFDVSRDT